jgi:hypothetical protein
VLRGSVRLLGGFWGVSAFGVAFFLLFLSKTGLFSCYFISHFKVKNAFAGRGLPALVCLWLLIFLPMLKIFAQ